MEVLIPLLLLPVLLALWCGGCWLLSLCGWWNFAKRFRAKSDPVGHWYRGRSGYLGTYGVSYRRLLDVCLGEKGIYVEVMLIFRVAHPSLLIPWDEVAGIRKRSVMGFEWLVIFLNEDGRRMRILLPAEAEEVLRNLSSETAARIRREGLPAMA